MSTAGPPRPEPRTAGVDMQRRRPAARTSPAHSHRHHPIQSLSSLLLVSVVGIFVLTFVVEPYRIPSESMVPTLRVGDFVMVDKAAFDSGSADTPPQTSRPSLRLLPPREIHRGDLVVFHFPPDPNRDLVKRVVAIPGDRLRLRAGHLIRNGQPVIEPYAFYSLDSPFDAYRDDFPNQRVADPNADPSWWMRLRRLTHDGEITVPPASYFVLGDNRNSSEDSRYWGFVPQRLVIGRPLVVYFALPDAAVVSSLRGNLLQRLGGVGRYALGRIGVLR